MWTIVGGIVVALLGVVGVVAWWGSFLEILKGMIPILLILGGVVAIAIGIDNIKMNRQLKSETSQPASN